ncbi:MAG: 4-hydroxythreonine-4-phosphate dehydrogenase PdxA [Candidatus Acidiferrales bacterium]|jgi:4-hydroxythreonine-4-phosphate dehydrogenase
MAEEKQRSIAVTIGDPAGVGAEVTLKALSDPAIASLANWIIVGDSWVLERTGQSCGIAPQQLRARVMDLKALPEKSGLRFGQISAECGAAAAKYVRAATEMCLSGEADAMVTAPLNKEAVTLSGTPFSGHTEFIAKLCGCQESWMLLANQRLGVVHVSTHVPLSKAIQLDAPRIVRTIKAGREAMQWLGFAQPRVAVCGLNPHAGEHGLFGAEDEAIIAPAIAQARQLGIPCSGPHAPDTIFLQASQGAYDLVVAMYHDQGHIPMKLIDFYETVNISVGIPIIRTSVDHGTAFDIAGQNKTDPRNMKAAMRMAASMVENRAKIRSAGSPPSSK